MRLPHQSFPGDLPLQQNFDVLQGIGETTAAPLNTASPVAVSDATWTTIAQAKAPAAGSYLVVGSFAFAASAAGTVRLGAVLFGSGFYGLQSAPFQAAISAYITVTAVLPKVSRGATVALGGYQNTGGSLNTAPVAGIPHTLSLVRLA